MSVASGTAASSQSSLELDQSCCQSDPEEPEGSSSVSARTSSAGTILFRLGAGSLFGCLAERLPAFGATFSFRLPVLLMILERLEGPALNLLQLYSLPE